MTAVKAAVGTVWVSKQTGNHLRVTGHRTSWEDGGLLVEVETLEGPNEGRRWALTPGQLDRLWALSPAVPGGGFAEARS